MRGLWKLAWLELKIFAREPLGVFGSVVVPLILFVLLGRFVGRRGMPGVDASVLVAMFIALGGVLSLVTIISIYREGGILKRLRATPLRPHTILTAHVVVKLLLTFVTLALMMLAGRRYFPGETAVPVMSVAVAFFIAMISILSIGFVIASVVPTARFAQPLGSLVLYPMLAVSGAFVPVEAMPPALQSVARMLPLTYAVALLRGIWSGDAWSSHVGNIAVLAGVFVVCVVVSSKVFRWE
jgi:ABC-2 type transport system permease protein